MKRIFLITVLLTFSLSTYAKQYVDSFYVHIIFEKGFFISKKAQIKLNDKIITSKRIKTNGPTGYRYSGSLGCFFTPEDKITIKIGLFQHKLNKDKLLNGYHYVWVNRYFLFNTYSYHKLPPLYN